ncbi:hypothetical protein GCM10009584_10620 [Ornithinimicrobium humiphilum]|uniref:Glycosyl transferase family 2 n=1 Tax=Ornithinimicrobium humiphilum TaxID=125288 RepID=A0A543KJB5_9MICO|nr:glycosyltransferase family A protein [Ornithinimicrobium humiphilum]TQM90274.1 glycosyl transferase family 2 [Ornithinimicrobium humiphilum]TQM95171.1 glycosyl transferase family 2 [Ornithinimicrobium humiphilum]
MTSAPDDLAAAAAGALPPGEDVVEAMERFALRTRSPLAADTLARAATGGTRALDALLADAAADPALVLDPAWGAATARVLALGPRPDAWDRAAEVYTALLRTVPAAALGRRAVTTWAQLLLRLGRDDELRALLADPGVGLADVDRWALRTDLANPWREGAAGPVSPSAEREWAATFNEVHAADDLEPVELLPDGDTAYQRLSATPRSTVDGELVTVLMSAYRPDRDILMAARSVLASSWTNLELLVVDDASPPGSEALLEEVEALDERVRVVRAPRNAGTYEARNLALGTARGRWLTFQDSDDWTHPRRVEAQVRALQERPGLVSCRTWTLRAYPDLTLTYVGYPPERLNASSLLLDRLETVRLVGGFDATRKSGDMELPLRLRAVRPGSHRDLRHPAPLAVTQLRSGSLSRTDAVPGWTRWTRLAYRDLYVEWHRRIAADRADAVLPGSRRPFPLPDPTWAPDRPATPPTPREHDVVVLGDLRADQPRSRATTALATALAGTSPRVALAHVEVPDPLLAARPDLLAEASAAVVDGRVALTDAGEPEHAAVLVVDGPAALLHLPEARLAVDEVLVLADAPPAPGSWTVDAVEQRSQELFGHRPRWAVRGEPSGELRELLAQERLLPAGLATVVDLDAAPPRPRPRTGVPGGDRVVVGHHLPDARARWPRTADEVRDAYLGEHLDVRSLRGTKTPTAALGRPLPPPSWLSLARTGMTVREFLGSLDVFVYQGTWDAAAEVATLEALAAGLPCVLPPEAAGSLADATDLPDPPVRLVPPAAVPAAVDELLRGTAEPAAVPRSRLAAWTRALRTLTTPTETARGALV